MPQSTIIPLYANGIFLSDKMLFALENAHEAIPVIGGNTPVAYAGIGQFFLQLFGCFHVPFPPDKRYDFAAVPVVSIDEPKPELAERVWSPLLTPNSLQRTPTLHAGSLPFGDSFFSYRNLEPGFSNMDHFIVRIRT